MRIDYRISMWNYNHYANTGSFEEVVQEISSNGYGVEIWQSFKEEKDLFAETERKRLKTLLEGINSSMHSAGVDTFAGHQRQIDTAAAIGSDVIVVHAGSLRVQQEADFTFAREVVAYAKEQNVIIALENGPLAVLAKSIEQIANLKICLDTGHVYFTSDPMSAYLDTLKSRLVHLHIQDTLPDSDHYIPGTGTIPEVDWRLILEILEEIDFNGAGVFEIRPRRPLQTAKEARDFLEQLK